MPNKNKIAFRDIGLPQPINSDSDVVGRRRAGILGDVDDSGKALVTNL